MVQYVGIDELRGIGLDDARLGYQRIRALGKTDVKWLVEALAARKVMQSAK